MDMFGPNAFIFLLLGLQINIPALVKSLHILMWVIPAILLARGIIVYGLMPIVSRLPNSYHIDLRYQTVMYWGSMRGGIAIAMLLSLGTFKHTETFVAAIAYSLRREQNLYLPVCYYTTNKANNPVDIIIYYVFFVKTRLSSSFLVRP